MASETLVNKNLDGEENYTMEGEVNEVMEEENEHVGTPEQEEEAEKSETSAKKRQRKRTAISTPIQRPSRERKGVQWYYSEVSENITSPKGLVIQEGSGTPLKDIPNVVFKLSKRKADENLQILHRILFGKRTKMHNLKRNLLQFSGFVWLENEDKQRAKIRERLDKFVKEQLLDFCDVLDIRVPTATRKDEVLGKLLEFLESPHATTEVSLADKEQVQKSKKLKRKKRQSTGSASRGSSSKKQKQSAKAKKIEDDDEIGSADAGHLSDEDNNLVTMGQEESNQEDDESLGEEDKANEMKVNKKISRKKSKERGSKAMDKAEKGNPKDVGKTTESESSPKANESPKKDVGKTTESESSPKANESPEKLVESPHFVSENGVATEDKIAGSHSKSKDSTSKTQKGNEKKSRKNQNASSENKKTGNLRVQSSGEEGANDVKSNVTEPSRDEMHAAVGEILKNVDFNTETLTDILKKLGSSFSMNLMHRKVEVKSIIEEVMCNMTDDEEDDDDDDDDEVKEDTKLAENGGEEDIKLAENGAEEAGGNNNH